MSKDTESQLETKILPNLEEYYTKLGKLLTENLPLPLRPENLQPMKYSHLCYYLKDDEHHLLIDNSLEALIVLNGDVELFKQCLNYASKRNKSKDISLLAYICGVSRDIKAMAYLLVKEEEANRPTASDIFIEAMKKEGFEVREVKGSMLSSKLK